MVAAPAKPPLNILIKRYLSLSCFIYLVVVKRSLKYYLKENPNACVGKYLTTLTQLPLHNAMTPSSFKHLIKQSTVPLYGLVTFEFYLCVCINNFTL